MSKVYPATPKASSTRRKTCLYCGKRLRGQQVKFCSYGHGRKYRYLSHRPPKGICRFCKKKPIAFGRYHFCSERCRKEAKKRRKRGLYTNKSKVHFKVLCPICGKEGSLVEITEYNKKTKKQIGMGHFAVKHFATHFL